MAIKQNPIFTELGIPKGRDPLVNENPELKPADEIRYLKAYIADGQERVTSSIARSNELSAKVKELEAKKDDLTDRPFSTRAYQIYKDIINGMAAAGVFEPGNLANRGGDRFVKSLFDHVAGLSEVAASRIASRF